MVHCTIPEAFPHDALPHVKNLRCMMYVLWATRYLAKPLARPSGVDIETYYLHFSFTYRVVSRIFVKHNNKPIELSYTLGTMHMSDGLVISTHILPIEKWDYMKLVFDDTDKLGTQAILIKWVDDRKKWR